MGRYHGGENEVVKVNTIRGDKVRKSSHVCKQLDFVKGTKLSRRWLMGHKAIHKVLIMGVSQWNRLVGALDK